MTPNSTVEDRPTFGSTLNYSKASCSRTGIPRRYVGANALLFTQLHMMLVLFVSFQLSCAYPKAPSLPKIPQDAQD